MRKTRWLISIPVVLAVSVLLFSLLYFRSFRSEPRLSLNIEQPPRSVTTPVITIRGQVSREAEIEVTRDRSTFGPVALENNKFAVAVELEPGENQITVKAQTARASSSSTVYVRWEPKNPPTPTINPLPPTTNLPAITVSGLAYPNGWVGLTIHPEAADRPPFYHSAAANKDGTFATKVELPATGTYRITATANNSHGARSAASAEVKTVYDPEWFPPANAAQSAKARPLIRKADLVLRHKQLTMKYEVTLPKDDPAVTALIANQGSLSDFIEDTFGLTINGRFYPAEFNNVVPEVFYKDQNATIKATTLPHRAMRDFLPVLRGELNIRGNRGFPFSSPDDRLCITTFDYSVESLEAQPTHVEKNTLSWNGGGNVPLFKVPEIKLKLAYNPFASPRNFLRLAQVSPYHLWEYPGNTIPHFVLGLLRVIPMLWVLWLLADWRHRNAIDPDLRNDLYKLSQTLITLSLVDTILNATRGLAYFAWVYDVEEPLQFIERFSFIGPVENYLPILEPLAALAIFLVALVVHFLAARISRRPWAIWLTRISYGIRNAALICILLELTWFLYFNPALTRVPNIIIITATLGYLFFRTAQVIRHASPTAKHNRRLIVLLVIVALIFLVPSAFTASRDEANWSLSQLFSMLDSVLPYALAIGLLVILKRADRWDQRRRRRVALNIGLILFSGFLVGTTLNLFMIPIPFIIAIWMYRHFLVYDVRKCVALDQVNDDVVKDRERLIDVVLTHETAQHFHAHSEKLRDKVTSGDITLKEFQAQKSEIDEYAWEKERESTHKNGLHARTTVLGIGPNTGDWNNGRWCVRWGSWLIGPFLLLYLLLLLLRPTTFSESVFGFMFGLNQLLTFVADWLLAAFFFGYFFRYIQGNSGLEKGFRTALVLIVCLLPTWLTGRGDLIGVLFGAVQTFLFFTLLGLAAFDYATFRNALRGQFRWRTFARFGDMPRFTAVVSVLVTSIGVVVTSVFTDQFTDLLTNLLGAVLQQAPGPPK